MEEWVLSLDRDDTISLCLFLDFHLKTLLRVNATTAAEYTSIMMGKSEKTIRTWINKNFDKIKENMQGRYQCRGLLWSNEDLNMKATKYVRENASVKGQPNMTAGSFCQWVNECLLPSSCLEAGFPRKISVETGRKWLDTLGFTVLQANKGAYFDGHERVDVIEYRNNFLKTMITCGFLHPEQAPTQRAFPNEVPLCAADTREKTVVIFHDESTFHANDDQTTMWGGG